MCREAISEIQETAHEITAQLFCPTLILYRCKRRDTVVRARVVK